MKVIVRCANNRVTKTEMEREIERLFQENKDLRVYVGHLHDELSLAQQKSEARRQVICERDKLIQELNEQIQSSEDELHEQTKQAEKLKTKVANVCAERDNFEASYKQVLQWWEAAQSKATKAEATADEYRIALMESDCRVDELEKQLEWARNKNDEWAAIAQDLRKKVENYEKSVTFAKLEEAQLEVNHLREEVARLTYERDTAVKGNAELIYEITELKDNLEVERNLRVEAEKEYDKTASEAYDLYQQVTNLTIENTRLENKVEELEDDVNTCHNNIDGYIEGNRRMRAEYEKKLEAEQDQTKHWHKKYDDLKENYDELIQLHREWGEEIDRLRKVIIELQTNRFTTDEFIGMIVKNFMPSTDK